jgi:hypothetical protein
MLYIGDCVVHAVEKVVHLANRVADIRNLSFGHHCTVTLLSCGPNLSQCQSLFLPQRGWLNGRERHTPA